MSHHLSFNPAQILDVLNLSKNATAIYSGNDVIIQSANDAMIAFWGKDSSVIGKPLEEAIPELKGQPFKKMLQDVLATGITNSGHAIPAQLRVNGELQTFYYDYEYRAIKNEAGETYCILHTASEVTERELNRTSLQKAKEQEEAQKKALIESENNLRLVILQAPVAIAIFRGPDYVVETVNGRALELWGRNENEVANKPILDTMPELKWQGIKDLLDNVYHKGEHFSATEHPIELTRNNKMETAFINFCYEPLYDSERVINGIITIGIEVTGQVLARKKLEESAAELRAINEEMAATNEELASSNKDLTEAREEERKTRSQLEEYEHRLELAIHSAEMGTWSADLATGTLNVSDRSRVIHGLNAGDSLTLTAALQMVLSEDRVMLERAIQNSIEQKSNFEVEYQIQPMDGSAAKWLRSTGKVYFDAEDKPALITGTILDITERKLDELRKNDFIGMVSHELKTPLTSLTAIVQIAGIKLKNNEDDFLKDAMIRANNQVKKMSNMINGFLNVSRLESGKIHLNMQEFRLENLLSDIVDELKLTTARHQFSLSLCNTTVWADKDKIGSVITNFLNNAVKYSPNDTTITVNCDISDNKAMVSVKDEGIGIDPSDVQNLFDRYYRVESMNAKHVSGFGIGLYLSAEIIKRHNGNIWVESEPGKGSTFYFTLPLL